MKLVLLFYSCLAYTLLAVNAAPSCSESQQCPEDQPCCNQYGECGTGSYCLGPCNPRFSYNLTACAPAPVCKSGHYTFETLSSVADSSKYLGDADTYAFVQNNQILSHNGDVLLTMANGSTGTVLTSTRAVWYGKISATLKTSRTQGVVSSFIIMSGIRDEVDYEFIGSFLEDAQTNYYWQEKFDYVEQNVSLSNTFENYHTYTIDWKEDSITWEIDGQTGRTLYRADTYNATSDSFKFPQTPSFVQISIWPGGYASNAQGTINWAGGNVDWSAQDIQNPGYFYVTLKDVSIECYNPPSHASMPGSSAYVYNSVEALNNSVEITNDEVKMGSFSAVGWNMNLGADDTLPSASGTRQQSSTAPLLDASVVASSKPVPSSAFGNTRELNTHHDAKPTGASNPKSSTTTRGSDSETKSTQKGQTTGTSGSASADKTMSSAKATGGFQQSESPSSSSAMPLILNTYSLIFLLAVCVFW